MERTSPITELKNVGEQRAKKLHRMGIDAGKRDHKDYRVFVLVGDGECNEGQVWEAAEAASKYQLDNMVVFVDNNRLQNDGTCADIMPTGDLKEKFQAFGFEAYRINGGTGAW